MGLFSRDKIYRIDGVTYAEFNKTGPLTRKRVNKLIENNGILRITAIDRIVIGKGVSEIEPGAIPSSVSISVNKNNKFYKTIDGNLYTKNGRVLVKYICKDKAETEFAVPQGVEKIGEYAFDYVGNLIRITLPSTLKSICYWGFYTYNLKLIIIPKSVEHVEKEAFFNCGKTRVFCESENAGEGWSDNWIDNIAPVIWGYKEKNKKAANSDSFNYTISSLDSLCTINIECNGILEKEYLNELFLNDEVLRAEKIAVKIGGDVSKIGERVFFYWKELISIELPSSLTHIGDSAFAGCTGLTVINLPNSLTELGASSFRSCKSLTSIKLPSSVVSIGGEAFSDCKSLTSIKLPEEISTIGGSLFYGCESLTAIELPSSVVSIGEGAFSDCKNLISAKLPEGISTIGGGLFCRCESLTAIELPSGVVSIGEDAFYKCKSLTKIEIPNDVEAIERFAFYGCSSLKEVIIPSGVTKIGKRAFYDCTALEKISIPQGIITIEEDTFDGCKKLIFNEVENALYLGNKENPYLVFIRPNDVKLKELKINPRCKIINSKAFSFCELLESVEIPKSVISIGAWAFLGCKSLKRVEIPNDVEAIEKSAFNGCSALKEVIIPSGVTKIGDYAFEGCIALRDIELPNSLTSIGIEVFDGCSGLIYNKNENALYLGNKENPYFALINIKNRNAENIKINENTRIIYANACTNCVNIKSVEIPKGVISIGYKAFNYCTSLENIQIPKGVISIGTLAFWECRSLKSIVIPETVTEMGGQVFFNCDGLLVNCEADSLPDTWAWNWKDECNIVVKWGYKKSDSSTTL